VHTVSSKEELLRNFKTKQAIHNLSGKKEITVVNIQKFKDGSSPLTHANSDQISKVFSDAGLWKSHNLSFSGGSDKGSYNVSLGYLNEGGLINNTGLERYTLRTNLDKDVNDRLKVGLNISGAFNKVTDPAAGVGWITHTAFREWANDPIQSSDGRWINPTWSGQQHNSLAYSSNEMGKSVARDVRIIATGFAEYQLINGLKLKGIASVLNDRNKTSMAIYGVNLYAINHLTGIVDSAPSSSLVNLNRDSPLVDSVSRNYFDNTDINFQLLLNYDKTFAKHHVKGLLGYDQREIVSEISSLSRRKILDPSLGEINAADPSFDDTSGNTTNFSSRSGFSRLNTSLIIFIARRCKTEISNLS
jgi:hypothetical protein